MRKPVIAANWKMFKTTAETSQFLEVFLPLVKGCHDVEILLAPPFTSLAVASEMLKVSGVRLCAQDAFYEKEGAFTGEISVNMIVDCGCSHVILGHSERRQYFKETDEILNKKVRAAIGGGLEVIFCVGETLEERETGKTFDIVGRELEIGLQGADYSKITIAYEPVWAIGTGKTATPGQSQEVHSFIRKKIGELGAVSKETGIIYGGSVKPANIKSLMEEKDIDGALVGGASLDPVSFSQIVKYN
ncbi:bifunctional PGK/TIM [bacterium BMS3Abin07]|nr:bifunctional PGK/TIM [bacterium BMS3Abin07]GBE32528.1 bifunctional PGK/TIM [bacterium BMS3Bbin05]HDO23431.1 triose-phosphate isomerase [Nitrospirota bacterium]HDZ88079.1 triose-phosphate isomerase [Nitrospirota bacterium]